MCCRRSQQSAELTLDIEMQRASTAQQQNLDIKQLFPYAFADAKSGTKATLHLAVRS